MVSVENFVFEALSHIIINCAVRSSAACRIEEEDHKDFTIEINALELFDYFSSLSGGDR
jgi:hypothetical protein